jgi:hypothetical protein
VAGRKNLFEEQVEMKDPKHYVRIPGERLRQDGYLSNHRCQSETLVLLTVSLASVVKAA